MNTLRIALTKGRLEKDAIGLFEKMGIDCGPLLQKGRRLIVSLEGGKYDVVLAKAPDVITYVEHGACDIGFVGRDTILECGGSFYEVLDLGFGKCRFAVAALPGVDVFSGYSQKKIATKYPKVAHDYFYEKGINIEIIKIEGSVELAPLLGLSDAIVDIVETGSTLRENGLVILEEMMPVSARMIVNTASTKMKKDEIDALTRGIRRQLEVKGDA